MKKSKRLPDQSQQQLLDEVRVELATSAQIPRINQLLSQHHYLGSLRPVGQRLYYLARNAAGQWVALLVFSAAAKPLKQREEWIGWSEEQRPLSVAARLHRAQSGLARAAPGSGAAAGGLANALWSPGGSSRNLR